MQNLLIGNQFPQHPLINFQSPKRLRDSPPGAPAAVNVLFRITNRLSTIPYPRQLSPNRAGTERDRRYVVASLPSLLPRTDVNHRCPKARRLDNAARTIAR